MTPKEVGRFMDHARRLQRLGVLDAYAFSVLDHLVWSGGRKPFADDVTCAYSAMQRALHMSRATVVRCVALLIAVGLIAKQRRSVTVPWHQGGMRRIVVANLYRLLRAPSASLTWLLWAAAAHCGSGKQSGRGELRKNNRQAHEQAGVVAALRAIAGRSPRPQNPVRSVAEQLALLGR